MKTVFFDIDGTLLDSIDTFASVFSQVVAGFGLSRSNEDVKQAMDRSWSWYESHVRDYPGREQEFWLGFNETICRELGLEGSSRSAGEIVTESFRNTMEMRLFEDAVPCLDALRSMGIRLGVITARPSALEVLASFQIAHYFTLLVDACLSGSAKLDHRVFQVALDLAQIPGTQAIHVGDRVERDIWPARAVGMLPVLIDRTEKEFSPDVRRIKNLAELPSIVRSLK